MKNDELRLLLFLFYSRVCKQKEIDIHPKRKRYILNKWAEKGLYDYGVSLEQGWLTPAGEALAAEMSSGGNPA